MISISPTLLGLVERYSPSGHEEEAVAFLVGRFKELGFTQAFVDKVGNAIGVIGEGPKTTVLLGHVDTVPGKIHVRVEGSVLYGRGSVDAKGSLAAFVDAVAALGPQAGWQYVVIGAVREESDSQGAWHVAHSYRPVYAIVGEPSGWYRVTLGYRGSLELSYSAQRSLAHPASGRETPCESVVNFWNRVKAACQEANVDRKSVFEQCTPTLISLHSGSDGFASWAEARISLRLPLDEAPEDWLNRLSELCGEGKLEVRGRPVRAFRAEKNTPLVQAFLAAIRANGGQPSFVLKSGTSDMNIVGPAWGCPILAYGPGDSALDHTPEEHLSLEEYALAVKVLTHALQTLLRLGESSEQMIRSYR